MAKISIFCTASFSHGMGHLVRQSHIAKILRNRGNEITFFHPRLLTRSTLAGSMRTLSPNSTDVKQVSSDLIILDVQDTSAAFIKNLRQDKKAVVSFEDLGEGRNHVDLLVDCNLGEEKSAGLPVQTLFGHNYAVLAEEFEAYHSKPRVFKNTIEFGAGDFWRYRPSLTNSDACRKTFAYPARSFHNASCRTWQRKHSGPEIFGKQT